MTRRDGANKCTDQIKIVRHAAFQVPRSKELNKQQEYNEHQHQHQQEQLQKELFIVQISAENTEAPSSCIRFSYL